MCSIQKPKRYFKEDLIKMVSGRTGFSKNQAADAVSATLDIITGILCESPQSSLQITGFGTFYTKECSERVARNPKTNEEVVVQARYTPAFKAGAVLKNLCERARKQ